METRTESKKQQWKNSISSASSSSRSSSISSDSSDGHFDIRHFPIPKPSLSASEAQKQRECNSSVSSSYTGSSWSSIRQTNLVDFPGYDPNRIPSSVFSSKPANSTEWSIASNESLFSIHDSNFIISTKEDHGLPAALRLGEEIPRLEGTVHEIIEINPVPLPPVKKPKDSKKETITEEEPYHVEESDSEIDDHEAQEEMTEFESKDHHEEEKEDIIKAEGLVETEIENPKAKEEVGAAKEKKPEDSSSILSHSPSISCLSDNSNNSIGSFAFPLLQKEDDNIQTPTMMIRGSVSHKHSPTYELPQSSMQSLPYSESSTRNVLQPQSQPQRKASKQFKSQTLSPKTWRTRWFSCFQCPSNCGLFK